jgi:prophage antirepressor-like protein
MKMNQIQLFTFPGTNDGFRVFGTFDDPRFLASEVCNRLGIGNHHRALARLDPDEKGVHSSDTPGGIQQTAFVNESGLYSLIGSSRKPEAKKFKKWVNSEVLPSIRKTGRYDIQEAARKLAMKHILLEMPAAWRRMFPDSFFEAILAVWDLKYTKARTPAFVGKIINWAVYDTFIAGLPAELKERRKAYGKGQEKLHQFINTEAKAHFERHLAIVEGIARGYPGRPEAFREHIQRMYHGRDQLLFLLTEKPKRLAKDRNNSPPHGLRN